MTSLNRLAGMFDQLVDVLTQGQMGDVASDHTAELEGSRGWNWVAIQAVARHAARAVACVFDDTKDVNAKVVRKALREKHGWNWVKSAANREGSGSLVSDPEHPLVRLLARPNPSQSGSHFLWERMQQLRLHGSCVVWNRPNKLYTRTVERYVIPVSMFQPIRPGALENMPNGGVRVLPGYYRNYANAVEENFAPIARFANIEIPVEQLTIVRYPHPHYRADGASTTNAISYWIDMAATIDLTRLEYFGEGPNGKLIFTTTETDAEKIASAERRLNERLGPNGPRATIVGTDGLSLVAKRTAEEMGFDATWEQMRDAILAGHGVAKSMVGLQDNMTFGSVKASIFSCVQLSIQPDLDLIADEDTLDLCSEYEDKRLSIEFEVPDISDPESEQTKLDSDAQRSVITVGEYRTRRGLPLFGNRFDSFILTSTGPVDPDTFLGGKQKPAIEEAPKLTLSLREPRKPVVAMFGSGDSTVLKSAGLDVIPFEDVEDPESVVASWDSDVEDVQQFAKSLPSQFQEKVCQILKSSGPHEYGCVLLPLPGWASEKVIDFGRQISEYDLGPGGLEDEPHVTLLYGLTGCTAAEVVRVVKEMTAPLVTLGMVTCFPAGDSGAPLKYDVDSPELHGLNSIIKSKLPYAETWPEYRPHVTIAYLNDGCQDAYEGKPAALTRQTMVLDRAIVSMPGEKRVIVPLRRVEPIADTTKAADFKDALRLFAKEVPNEVGG